MKRQFMLIRVLVFAVITSGCGDRVEPTTHRPLSARLDKAESVFTNSIGMQMVLIAPGSFVMGESATPLPNELTKNLSYPKRAELVKKFPHGDPDKFAITVAHVREGDFDEKPARCDERSEASPQGQYQSAFLYGCL